LISEISQTGTAPTRKVLDHAAEHATGFFKNLFGIRKDVRVRDYQGFFQIQENSSETCKILFSFLVVNWFFGNYAESTI